MRNVTSETISNDDIKATKSDYKTIAVVIAGILLLAGLISIPIIVDKTSKDHQNKDGGPSMEGGTGAEPRDGTPRDGGDGIKGCDKGRFKLIDARGDGNCMFHCFDYYFRKDGKKISAPEIRKASVDYQVKNEVFFYPLIEKDGFTDKPSWEEFMFQKRTLKTPKYWGLKNDAYALMEKYNICVYIYNINTDEPEIPNAGEEKHSIWLEGCDKLGKENRINLYMSEDFNHWQHLKLLNSGKTEIDISDDAINERKSIFNFVQERMRSTLRNIDDITAAVNGPELKIKEAEDKYEYYDPKQKDDTGIKSRLANIVGLNDIKRYKEYSDGIIETMYSDSLFNVLSKCLKIGSSEEKKKIRQETIDQQLKQENVEFYLSRDDKGFFNTDDNGATYFHFMGQKRAAEAPVPGQYWGRLNDIYAAQEAFNVCIKLYRIKEKKFELIAPRGNVAAHKVWLDGCNAFQNNNIIKLVTYGTKDSGFWANLYKNINVISISPSDIDKRKREYNFEEKRRESDTIQNIDDVVGPVFDEATKKRTKQKSKKGRNKVIKTIRKKERKQLSLHKKM